MHLMHKVFQELLGSSVIVYLDDILVFSKDKAQHLQDLRKVFQILRDNQLYANPKKCEFFRESLQFLGHVVTNQGIMTDPSKTDTIKSWPVPKDLTQLRGFLGLANFYHKFVPNFATVSAPLTN